MTITGEIKSKVDKLWTTFWNNGISNPLSVIEQISYLLFIKRLDDLELLKEKKAQKFKTPVKDSTFSAEQQKSRWSHFKNLSDADEMLRIVRDEAFPFIKNLGGTAVETAYARHMKDAVFLIASPALLTNVVSQIEQIPMKDRDTKGDLYEYMLSKLTTAGTNGQFRTPRHIIKMMVDLMNPGAREIICDPACGTGGFLVAAAEYMQNLRDSEGSLILNAPGNREHFNSEMFHGFDFDGTMLRIGSMNLMLHGIENPDIQARNSVTEENSELQEAFTLVLANPPFKGSINIYDVSSQLLKDIGKSIPKRSSNSSKSKSQGKPKKPPGAATELLFIALIIRLLKVGGRAAIIVPDGVLFGSSKSHKEVRKNLVEDHKLEGIISMPSGVFKPYAGVSTAILIFTKTTAGGTDHVWFYDMKADGLSLDDKRQEVEANDIPDILEKWHKRDPKQESDRKAQAFFVPKEEIKAEGYDLSINRYKEIEYEEVEYEPPKVILGKLRSLEAEISSDLDALEKMLG